MWTSSICGAFRRPIFSCNDAHCSCDNAESMFKLFKTILPVIFIRISGSYITVKSNIGQAGDQVTLLSLMKAFVEGTELSFYYHMRLSDEDTTAALTVFTYSQLHVYEKRLVEIQGNHGTSWKRMKVRLPAGTYQLAFVATHGLQFLSDIALDDIFVELDPSVADGHDAKRIKGIILIYQMFQNIVPIVCCHEFDNHYRNSDTKRFVAVCRQHCCLSTLQLTTVMPLPRSMRWGADPVGPISTKIDTVVYSG